MEQPHHDGEDDTHGQRDRSEIANPLPGLTSRERKERGFGVPASERLAPGLELALILVAARLHCAYVHSKKSNLEKLILLRVLLGYLLHNGILDYLILWC